jgi:hypothetical protein
MIRFVRCKEVTAKGSIPGRTTGWIHRTELKHRGVQMVAGATYDQIDDDGLHYQMHGEKHVLAVDNVILCTGQEPNRALYDELRARGVDSHVIGGADVAVELRREAGHQVPTTSQANKGIPYITYRYLSLLRNRIVHLPLYLPPKLLGYWGSGHSIGCALCVVGP